MKATKRNEISNIYHDVRTGALPAEEVPGFLVWILRGIAASFWFWFALILIGGTIAIAMAG
jgi:hypothetical protein